MLRAPCHIISQMLIYQSPYGKEQKLKVGGGRRGGEERRDDRAKQLQSSMLMGLPAFSFSVG